VFLSKLAQAVKQIPAGFRALVLVWKATQGWTLAWVILLLCQGVIPAGGALLLRSLINRLAHGQPWSQVVAPALGIALLWLMAQFTASVLSYVRAVQAEKVQDLVHALLHEQAIRLDLSFYDQANSYDLLHRVRIDALSQPLALIENLGAILQNSLSFIVLAGILARYATWMPLLLLASSLPGLLLVGRQILREHQWNHAHTSQERHVRYLDWMLTERNSAAELRIFNLGPTFRQRFQTLRSGLSSGRIRLASQAAAAEWTAGAIAWAGTLAGLGWMLHRTQVGLVGLGDLLLCLQVFQLAQSQLRTLLEGSGKVFRSLLFIENLDLFLALRPSITSGVGAGAGLPVRSAIRFEQVSFTYPGSSHRALDDFSLEIPAGKVVALVGRNGAGKTTLIKLLCRFYDPDHGRILFDGSDLRELDPEALRKQITVLFQDPVRYQASARENIAFGQVDRQENEVEIMAAAEAAGAVSFLSRLPNGFDTWLGKWFGGEELSGGEWQRVALARAFFRQADLVILDEPTSAMDSWSEQDWLQRFRALTVGRTGLMITHRFTTAMHADVIHVLDQGRVIESGTHPELIALDGLYARSWAAQMREMDEMTPKTLEHFHA